VLWSVVLAVVVVDGLASVVFTSGTVEVVEGSMVKGSAREGGKKKKSPFLFVCSTPGEELSASGLGDILMSSLGGVVGEGARHGKRKKSEMTIVMGKDFSSVFCIREGTQ